MKNVTIKKIKPVRKEREFMKGKKIFKWNVDENTASAGIRRIAAGALAMTLTLFCVPGASMKAYAADENILVQQMIDPDIVLLQMAQQEVAAQGINLIKYRNISILGDSITEGVGARTPDKAYPNVLSTLTAARVNNYGLSCSRITDVNNEYAPGSYIDRMYYMDKSSDLIIVFGGTNDFWYGDCPIGKRTDTSADTFYGALNTMISYLKNAYPLSDIVFITPYQQSKDAEVDKPYKRSTYSNFGTGTLSDYRTALLDRCQYYNIPVLDLYADMELNTADNRQALEAYGNYLCDGCHLNNAGYNLLARKIYKFIMQDLNAYIPEYVEADNMVFDTRALAALATPYGFMLPNGKIIQYAPGFTSDASMPLLQLYHNFLMATNTAGI